MKKLLEFFQDASGMFSAFRLVFIAWNFGFLFLIMFLTLKNGDFPKIDSQMVMLYTSVIGGKIMQSFSENFSPNTPHP